MFSNIIFLPNISINTLLVDSFEMIVERLHI